jgi:hypothetical protein
MNTKTMQNTPAAGLNKAITLSTPIMHHITNSFLLATMFVSMPTHTMSSLESSQPVETTITVRNATSIPFTLSYHMFDSVGQVRRTSHQCLSPHHRVTIHPLVAQNNKTYVTLYRSDLDLDLEVDLELNRTMLSIIHADETGFLAQDNFRYKYGVERTYENRFTHE